GAVTVSADNVAEIDAKIIAASIGVGIGKAGIGASIGVSLARNLIGASRDESMVADHESTDSVLTLHKGDTVRVASGVREGDVYEYLGDDFTVTYDHTYSAGSAATTAVDKGERVRVGDDV